MAEPFTCIRVITKRMQIPQSLENHSSANCQALPI